MKQVTRIIVVTLCAGLTWLSLSCLAWGAPPTKVRAVIVRAAGALPGQDKPGGSDAITHATPKPMNTYVFTEALAESLADLRVETRIVDFSECRNLECLLPPGTDSSGKVDILVFAGPAYHSKLPTQLQALFPKLGEIARSSPDLVCSSLIAAWYPDSKGIKAAEHADRAFAIASLRTVKGISLLTPREKKRGITQRALEKDLANFAARLVAKAQSDTTEADNTVRFSLGI
jgi:hypothetical protein